MVTRLQRMTEGRQSLRALSVPPRPAVPVGLLASVVVGRPFTSWMLEAPEVPRFQVLVVELASASRVRLQRVDGTVVLGEVRLGLTLDGTLVVDCESATLAGGDAWRAVLRGRLDHAALAVGEIALGTGAGSVSVLAWAHCDALAALTRRALAPLAAAAPQWRDDLRDPAAPYVR